jgi:amino acid adenylation domain-containing protein
MSVRLSREQKDVIERFNRTAADFPSVTLAEMFTEQVKKTPQQEAVRYGAASLTYFELNQQANRLAHFLRKKGAGSNQLIGCCLNRSMELAWTVVGIIKSAAACVPFDATYPPERIRYMIRQSGIKMVIAENEFTSLFSGQGIEVIPLDKLKEWLRAESDSEPEIISHPQDALYVLFTSGSTGQPKGVVMIHQALTNLLHWQNNRTSLGEPAVTLQFAPISFDVSFQELFSTWTTGGCIVMIDDEQRLNALQLLKFIEKEKINRLFLPFVALQHLAQVASENHLYPSCLNDIITAGEQLRITSAIRKFFTELKHTRLHNHYGPTETHVVTAYTLPSDAGQWPELPPIGQPIANTCIYLLNEQMLPVLPGQEGELYVGGKALARGYIHADVLTKERFLPNPFGEGRIYKTGDLARYLPDGNIEFLGRADTQVKLRGYRIELGEVEAAIEKFKGVKQAVVNLYRDSQDNKKLVAYLILQPGNIFQVPALRTHLKSLLPDYMIPAVYMPLSDFPRTPSGKIDRRSLPVPENKRPELDTLFVEPVSPLQKKLADLWCDLLDIDRVGIDDNFFDLGGNSLLALQMIARLKSVLERDLSVVALYQHPTIRGIENIMEGKPAETFYQKAQARLTKEFTARPMIKSVEDGIAIIGMAGRFPGASSVEELWKLLSEGREGIRFFRKEELDPSIPEELKNDPFYVPARGIVENADGFDADFFGMNPKVAEMMDPQHRILLETAWEALEHAGYDPSRYKGMIGVFAGTGNNTYYLNNVLPDREEVERVGSFLVMTANEKDYIATRLAHELNLTGPALSIHTACSTSLVAVAVAYEYLLTYQCDMALAGSASVTSPIYSGHLYNEGGMFSSDGHTRPFDERATGTVFSDGCGMVVLKRYRDALRDGDTIHAVIRGAALNNDGSIKASFTAPSVEGQAMVIAMAQAQAGISADTITYVEAHGTATPLGDPIEVEALTQAFRGSTQRKQYCALGSVKSNLGHLTAAAGVASLIKTVLALKHRKIPPTLHYEKPNPAIDFANSPFFVNTQLIDWKTDGQPRRAGISSFGVGGTNVHVIVEEAPASSPSSIARNRHLMLVSARTENALEAATRRLSDYLAAHPEINLADAAFTLQTGRKHFHHRRYIICDKPVLEITPKNSSMRVLQSPATGVVFMFPGQGSQYVDMGRTLYRDEIVYRQAVDQCAEYFHKYLGEDIRKILFPDDNFYSQAESRINETVNTQPCLFTTGYALAELWKSWGIHPAALIGHSIGEYIAACLAGIMSLEDSCFLVAHRGKMMQSLPGGAMLSVRAAAAHLTDYLSEKISIAAINGKQLCVLSGETDSIEQVQALLEEKGIACKRLITSHAFHSPMMEPIIKPFEEKVRCVHLKEPQIPVLSTVTADWLTPHQATNPAYWSEQIRHPVRFAEGIKTIWQTHPTYLMLELGPRQTATTMARQMSTDAERQIAIPSLGDTWHDESEWETLLSAIGHLWLYGIEIQWENFYALEKRKRVPLPSYPFERKRYWKDIKVKAASVPSTTVSPPVADIAAPALTCSLPPISPMNIVTMNNRKEKLIAELRTLMEYASGMDLKNAPVTVSFLELGLDSLFLTQSALSISKRYGVKVTFRQLNDELSTLEALAAYLDKHLPAEATVTHAAVPLPATPPATSLPITSTDQSGLMNMLMMQQMQLLQLMMQQMKPAQQPVAPSVQAHIEKSVEIKSHTRQEDLSENEKAELEKPFGAIARIEKTVSAELTDKQKQWLDRFIELYNKKTAGSKQWCQKHRQHLADPRVVTGFKPILKEIIYQIVVNRSKGVKLWDIDGNEYVDVLNGFGSNFFGWGSDLLMPVWKKQLEEGIELGPQTPLAGECAELICELTGYDRAAFCNTGSEAVLGAMRIARTVTGKNLIVCFNGSYHGINDEVIVRGTRNLKSFPAAAGIPGESVQNMLVLDYGTPQSLEIIRERLDEIAAVLIEPIQSRRADFHPREFIHEVRRITSGGETLMIFDEVITGFRLRLGGAQEYYEVKADISTYGKVIGGNMPIGVIAGRRPFMDALDGGYWQFGDASVPEAGVTYFAGTFVRHPLAMAAMKEVLLFLKRQGKALYEQLNARTQRLVDEVNAHARNLHIPYKLVTFGSLFKSKWDVEPPYTELLFALMRYKGVHIMDGFPCFLTLAFTDEDVDFVVRCFKESLTELTEAGFIPCQEQPAAALTNGRGNGRQPAEVRPPVPGAKLGKDASGKPAWFIPDPDRPGKFLQIK